MMLVVVVLEVCVSCRSDPGCVDLTGMECDCSFLKLMNGLILAIICCLFYNSERCVGLGRFGV